MKPGDNRNTPLAIVQMIREFAPVKLDPFSNETSPFTEARTRYDGSPVWCGLSNTWNLHERGTVIPVNGPWSDLLPVVEKCVHEYRKHDVEIVFIARTESATEWARLLCETRVMHVDLRDRYEFTLDARYLPEGTELKNFADTRPTTLSYWGERTERFRSLMSRHGYVYAR